MRPSRIGPAFLWLSAGVAVFAGLLALVMRWSLAWPGGRVPIFGRLHDWPGGAMPATSYAKTFTLHGTLMIWGVVVPAIAWGLGLACVPRLLGERRVRLERAARLGLALHGLALSILLVGWASSGWTAYAPLASGYEVADRWVPYVSDWASWLRLQAGTGFDRRQSTWSSLALYANLIVATAAAWIVLLKRSCVSSTRSLTSTRLRVGDTQLLRRLLIAGASLAFGSVWVLAMQRVAIDGQTAWFCAVALWAASGCCVATSLLTTIALRRKPGPVASAVWGWGAAAAVGLLAGPVIAVAMLAHLLDAHGLTGFFRPDAGGQPLLYQHLFWFYGHPLVYLMILPAYGLATDALAKANRLNYRRAPGHRLAALCIVVVATLGFGVWAHHMFQSGLDPKASLVFSAASILIAAPSATLVVIWIRLLSRRNLPLTPAQWAAIAFVSLFAIGGLSGLVLAAPAINVHLHDTYFVVAHLHFTLFGGAIFGLLIGVYDLGPRLLGLRWSTALAKAHVALTYVGFVGTFGAMHLLGAIGMPRRYADPAVVPRFADYAGWQRLMTVCAIALGIAQLLLVVNVFRALCGRLSRSWGRRREPAQPTAGKLSES